MNQQDVVMIQCTRYEFANYIVLLPDNKSMRYDTWLDEEKKRFRRNGRKAEVRRASGKKALFVDKVA